MTEVDPNYIDALVAGEDYRWNYGSAFGTGVSLTYSFMASLPDYAEPDDGIGFAVMTKIQQEQALLALESWAKVANITLTQVSDSGGGGDIRFGTNDQGDASTAYAYFPDGSEAGGDLYLSNTDSDNDNPAPGTYGFATLIHELGHALGLKHPGNYGDGDEPPFLAGAYDNNQYTVMAYDEAANGLDAESPLLYDIAAIQALYGANMDYATGDDVYVFTDSARNQCIWDAGGFDTFDFRALSDAVRIDLIAGSFSDYGRNSNGDLVDDALSIAFGVTIEDVYGTLGNDTISGNDGENWLFGNEGGDSIVARENNDLVYGNAGNDRIYGNTGNDILFGGRDVDQLFGGRDDDTIYGNLGTDIVYGNQGRDLIFGGQEIDFLYGGSEADTLYGSAGNDTLFGNGGDDDLIGGGGGDAFFAGNGEEWVYDFDFDGGDRILLPTLDYQVLQDDNGFTVFAYSGGSITLLGVTGFEELWLG